MDKVENRRKQSTINRNSGSRARFSTTIDSDIYNEFKAKCDYDGYTMSAVLEAFMRQYNHGEFSIALVKTKHDADIWDSDENTEDDMISCIDELVIE